MLRGSQWLDMMLIFRMDYREMVLQRRPSHENTGGREQPPLGIARSETALIRSRRAEVVRFGSNW
jgi:hypothetical protein